MATIPGEGTTLGYGSTQGSYTNIPQLVSVSPPGGEVASVDKTYLSSVAKEKRAGRIPDAGQFSFDIEYDPNDSTHQALYALVWTPANQWWQLVYNDGLTVTNAEIEFEGFITNWEPEDLEDESNLRVSVTVEITGVITSTAGS